VGWLRAAGAHVPSDVAYADLDVPADDGSVAGIYQDAEGIGSAAIDLVAGQLLRHERGLPERPKAISIESRWVDGATAPSLPALADATSAAPRRLAAIPRPVSFD
jgi:LacI family transcriptional regulator